MEAIEYAVPGALELERGSVLRIARARGLIVHVLRGEVWITQERDLEDHFVRAGARFRIANAGLTLVSALWPSALSFTASRPGSHVGQFVFTH